VWSDLVVVISPCLDRCLRIDQAREVILVQAFIAKLSVEALDVGVLNGLPRLDEEKRYPVLVCPEVYCLTNELRTVVADNCFRISAFDRDTIECTRHSLAR